MPLAARHCHFVRRMTPLHAPKRSQALGQRLWMGRVRPFSQTCGHMRLIASTSSHLQQPERLCWMPRATTRRQDTTFIQFSAIARALVITTFTRALCPSTAHVLAVSASARYPRSSLRSAMWMISRLSASRAIGACGWSSTSKNGWRSYHSV